MNRQTSTKAHEQKPTGTLSARGLLQRQCACGNHTMAGGECAECSKKQQTLQRASLSPRRIVTGDERREVPPIVHDVRRSPGQSLDATTRAFMEPKFGHDFSQIPVHLKTPARLQPKLTVTMPGDIFEQEADRIADQVLAASAHPAVSATPLRIQRFAGQPTGQADTPPASVDRTLASAGSPLQPALQQDMEQRFGYDFSRVRVHSGSAAEQSARDVNAHAYTVGHKMVFGAGRFAPGTHEGRRLLAHELTHVVQQRGAGLDRPDSVHAHSPDRAIQRKEKEEKSPIELKKEEGLKVVSEIETNWKTIRDDAANFDDVKPWLENGNAVVRLIREHTNLAFKALEGGDSEASMAYQYALESDLVTYQLISWHVVVHVNLLALKPDINGLIAAFDADDRAFTGRDKVEELTRAMDDLIDVFPGQAAQLLSQINVKSPLMVKVGATRQVEMTATNASDSGTKKEFEKEIAGLVQLQVAIQVTVSETNAFVVTARKEGAWQAVEALAEFYQARGGKGKGRGPEVSKSKGKGKNQKQDKEKGKDKKKDKDKDKNKKKREPFIMRFQVQWGSNQGGPTFALPATASTDPGVTTTQAVATLTATVALVTPSTAKVAAAPAAARQIIWIRSRPPAGIAVGGYSKSEYFPYGRYTDARVDVENIIGHNLRK